MFPRGTPVVLWFLGLSRGKDDGVEIQSESLIAFPGSS